MNEKIKSHLQAFCDKESYPMNLDNPRDVAEILTEGGKIIYTEITGEHRWYEDEFNVTEINGMKIGFNWFHMTGDDSPSDMDLDFDISSVCEVEEVIIQKTTYKPVAK